MTFTNKMQNHVLEFHKQFKHPHNEKPTLPSLERFVDRKGWGCIEETVEQLQTLSNNKEDFLNAVDKLKQYIDKAVEKQLSKPFITDEKEKIVNLADGLADELYFLLGDCVESGIDIEPILDIVQESNMSKLFVDEDGNKYAKYDENGKVIKSPNFFQPEGQIKKEIERQLNK